MNNLDKYLLPLLGVAIIVLSMLIDLIGFGSPGFGPLQIVLILFGISLSIVGIQSNIRPINLLKNICNSLKNVRYVNRRHVGYILIIFVFQYLFFDLILGRFYPKIYTPTKYGWSVTENYKFSRTVQDTKDNYREVSIQYHSHGFKRWPKNSDNRPRVLIIGDSFTQMDYVSNGEEWYAYIEKAFPDIAFFVFGGGGYGTLQEYMVLDDHFDNINPDAIILQFCDNDYDNNYYELDIRGYPLNNHFVRPYWEKNGIVYRLPLPYPKLRAYSFSADRLLHLYDRKRWRDAVNDLSEYLKRRDEEQDNQSPHEKKALKSDKSKAVEVTRFLARKIRSRVGNIPVYFFNACGMLTDNDRSICKAGDFRCIEDFDDYLKKIADGGPQMKVEGDGHWNYRGNQYVGINFAEYFKKIGGIIPDMRHQNV